DNGEEEPHGDQAGEPDLAQRYGPRKQERDLQIEHDEQDRNQVVAHVEFRAAVLEGLEAALVRGQLGAITVKAGEVAADAGAQHQQDHSQTGGNDQENQHGDVVRQHCTLVVRKKGRSNRDLPPWRVGIVAAQSVVLVPTVGFEPTHLAALAPQASVSTNSTTWATSQTARDAPRLTSARAPEREPACQPVRRLAAARACPRLAPVCRWRLRRGWSSAPRWRACPCRPAP